MVPHRRIQIPEYDIRKTAFGIHHTSVTKNDFIPRTMRIAMFHTVPLIEKFVEAPDAASIHHLFSEPKKYDLRLLADFLEKRKPDTIAAAKQQATMMKSMGWKFILA